MDIQLRNQNDCTLAVDPLVLISSCQSRAGLRRLSRVGARDVMVAISAPSALSALGAGQVFLQTRLLRRRSNRAAEPHLAALSSRVSYGEHHLICTEAPVCER